jgi:hypothetical protein
MAGDRYFITGQASYFKIVVMLSIHYRIIWLIKTKGSEYQDFFA